MKINHTENRTEWKIMEDVFMGALLGCGTRGS